MSRNKDVENLPGKQCQDDVSWGFFSGLSRKFLPTVEKKCYSCIAQGLRDALGFVAKDREGIDVLFFNSACVSFSTRSEMAQKRDFIKHIKNIDIIHNGGFTTQ